MRRIEHRKLVAGDVLEFPPLAAGVDPRPVRMGAAIAHRRAAVAISHADQVMRGALVVAERLDGAVDRVDAVLGGGFRNARRRIEARRHAPRAGIGFRKADEVGAFRLGARDEAHRVGDVFFVLADRVGNRLHDGDAEGHGHNSSIKRRTLMANRLD
jgi:hypothetical protein